MSFSLLILSYLFVNFSLFAQAEDVGNEQKTLKSQYEELIDKSNSYEQYKVIKKVSLDELKSVMVDTLQGLYSELNQAKQEISKQGEKINSLNKELSASNEERDLANLEKNSISFMGIQMDKSSYKATMWTIVCVLALALLIFIYKFLESNRITVQSRKELRETQEEMDDQRKTHIKKEQKIMRQLQDEINKNL